MLIKVTANLDFLRQLPESPGVYRFYAAAGELLYVGKALNLLKRIKSYFGKEQRLSPRINLMVGQIASIQITLTENEASALILENNLIKSHQPKYNIVFRDDKSYPYIRLSRHDFPLLEYTRRKPSKDALYFGPYPNSGAAKETLDLLQRLFKLRTCSDSTFANRSRPCLLYQIQRCSAPCVKKIEKAEYEQALSQAIAFLRGDYAKLVQQLTGEMYKAAKELDFETAGALRDKINMLKQVQERQIISNSNTPIDADLISYQESNATGYIYLILIRAGLYVGDKHFELALAPDLNVVEAFLEEYYARATKVFKIYTQYKFGAEFVQFFYTQYKVKIENKLNDKRINELYLMAQNNLANIIENHNKHNIYIAGVAKLADLLHLKFIARLECYDTSHHHGTSTVTSMTVYQDGIINPALYRKFNLSDAIKGDDLLALKTVLRRRLANQSLPVPEVILVDGGYTQLNQAKNIIEELGFHDKIKVIAIFKGEMRKPELDKVIIAKHVELNYADQPQLFRLLQLLRDEAHRFAITGHRKKQADKMQYSRLEEIPGIGGHKRKTLIAFFGSVRQVATASIEELRQVPGIGSAIAHQIYTYFHS